MIIIDGKQTELSISNFENLEQLLVSVSNTDEMSERIVTDILVNKEQFSELYPHQAEDIESDELESVEIVSVPYKQMALDITTELYKVSKLMQISSTEISNYFRAVNTEEGLPLFLDLINVIRNFMAMVAVLRSEFIDRVDEKFVNHVEAISQILGEMNEVLISEDWLVLADLMEFEFKPTCQGWETILDNLQNDIKTII